MTGSCHGSIFFVTNQLPAGTLLMNIYTIPVSSFETFFRSAYFIEILLPSNENFDSQTNR
jgi:hypothetical protein